MKCLLSIVFVVLVSVGHLGIRTDAAKILLFMPLTTKSETILFYPLSQELVKRGHHVTIVSPFAMEGNATGIEMILTELNLEDVGEDLLQMRLSDESKGPEWESMQLAVDETVFVAEKVVSNPSVRKLYNSGRKFDLIIVDGTLNDCSFAFIHRFKAPFIYIETTGLNPWHVKSTGNVYFSSVTPNVIGGEYGDQMNIFRRTENLFRLVAWHWYREQHVLPYVEEKMKNAGLLEEDAPSFIDIEKNVSLILVHRHPLLEFPTPTLANVVKLGCLQCRPGKPLPKDLESFVNGAGDAGFIYFSLGSVLRLDRNRDFFKKNFFSAFAKLPQRVLVKWDKDIKNEEVGAPPNVKFVKWLPQQDILGHPKCRVFISHGGLLSAHEAMYHGTPMLVIPLFWDQEYNALVLKRQGMATSIKVKTATPEIILESLTDVISPTYKENAKRLSRFIKDEPMRAMETEIYWIEYVIWNRGTAFIPPVSANMPWYQLLQVDVYLVIAAMLFIFIFMFYLMFKKLFSLIFALCGRKTAIVPKRKKKQQ